MFAQDYAGQINTDVDAPPDMEFRGRYVYESGVGLREVARVVTGTLMKPIRTARWFTPRGLSPVAKIDAASGLPLDSYDHKLPHPAIAATLIAQHQGQTPTASGSAAAFPFKLRAIGRVNGMQIYLRGGQPGEMLSDTVAIVP